MKKILPLLLAILMPLADAANPSPAGREEIAHLFAHLEKSGCRFNRNGNWYDAKEASAHLNKKYEYLLDRGLAPDAESFIDRAASRSSMSGKEYQVQCGNGPAVRSADWFKAELTKYRGRAK